MALVTAEAARSPPPRPGGGMRSARRYRSPLRRVMKSAERATDTLIWLATEPAGQLRQGGYYSNRRPGLVNVQALSRSLPRQLWDRTEQLLRTAG